jgi:gas vesicle structural protein
MTVAPRSGKGMEPRRESEGTLIHVVETLLDKGLVLNADIMVSVAGVELLGIRLRAALASFETAAKYGLEFPAGTDTSTVAWREAIEQKETCPQCGKRAPLEMLMNQYCPWCGWQSAYALRDGGSSDELPAGRGGDTADEDSLDGDEKATDGDEDSAAAGEDEASSATSSAARSAPARSSSSRSSSTKSSSASGSKSSAASGSKSSAAGGSTRKRAPSRSSKSAKPAEE